MKTKIEWATHTWNPVTGCTPISEGCEHCYAARMAKRLAGRCGYPHDDPIYTLRNYERGPRGKGINWTYTNKILKNMRG